MKKALISKSLEDTAAFAKDVLKSIQKGPEATILCLSGDLGSGKTAFVKEFGAILGIPKDSITSPTFVIEKIYQLTTGNKNQSFTHLIHIDAYRLENERELETLGWKEIATDPKNLILIEWPEMVPTIIPQDAKHITFEFINETTREITIV